MINRNTISNILKKPYDKVLFAKDILKPVFQNFQLRTEAIEANIELTQTEQKAISKVFIYGSITLSDDTEIKCYEIILQPSVHIEQNKVTIQQYVRKLLITGQAALINFISPVNDAIWRFTLVAKDSVFTEEGVKETATHPKRYTYLIETGLNKNNRTLAERLEVLSSIQDQNLQSLINAFSVETLSKAFFDEYKAHYNKFIQYLNTSNFFISIFKTNDKTVRDFTKKLLGRLVFLYFVQRKGWLGASNDKYKDGDHNFLSNLFIQSGCNDSFYPVWLKTLFFDTLNNPLKKGDFKMPDGTIVKIPFLNGGLFDKDDIDNYDFTIPADLFHNETQSELPLKRGFFDFLNAFNFTIYEDSPDDHTVAVDPEMLGHIFENLLEDNKDKGAFYTPKQIVHYMCQESLIQYLITNYEPGNNDKSKNSIENLIRNKHLDNHLNFGIINELLDKVKICDPAIGSGAFPVGLLHEIFSLKEIIADHFGKELNRAEAKENIIQNSIYGVDIEKGAVDIARLRFWLSLVVDEDNPKPLPNLDYKIVVGNSLLSKFEDEVLEIDWKLTNNPALQQSRPDLYKRINETIQSIFIEQKDFFHPKTDKNKLKLKIRNLKIDLIEILIEIQKQNILEKGINPDYASKKQEINEITKRKLKYEGLNLMLFKLKSIRQDTSKHENYFDWKLDFPEIMNSELNKQAGFDIVIGNPPYIQLQKNGGSLAKLFENQNFETFERTGDIYSLFYEKGIQLLNKDGILCFITSNKWMRANYGATTRQFFAEKTNPLLLIDFGNVQVFDTATVDTNIIILKNKQKGRKSETKGLFATRLKNDFNLKGDKLSNYVGKNGYYITSLSHNSWVVGEKDIYDIKSYVENQGIPLLDWGKDLDFKRGVLTGFNDAFIIPKKIRDQLIENEPKSINIIKPILRGKDTSAWYPEFEEYYLIGTFPSLNIDIENYQGIKNYLLSFGKARLEQDGNGRKKTGNKWFETQDQISYWKDFEKPKIIFPNMTKFLPFIYDETKFYTNQKCFIVTGRSLKYLTVFFNSKLFKYCFKDYFPELQGGTRELSKVFFQKIPVKRISDVEEIPFSKMVDYLIACKREKLNNSNDEFMFIYFEQIANALIYELYFKEEFEKNKLYVAQYIKELPDLNENENKLHQLRRIFITVSKQEHPVSQAIFSMNSLPQIAIINNTDL
ncbi:MAG: Eco57I restriction-modification methylase domain-containing protein [Bacteroidales bacterium]